MTNAFFAIRQKSTGFFMPEYGSRKGRGGYTNDDPPGRLAGDSLRADSVSSGQHPPQSFWPTRP